MIRTRLQPKDVIHGSGEYTISVTHDELQLMSSILYLMAMGYTPYRVAAGKLLTTIEAVTKDDSFGEAALEEVNPLFNIHDEDTYDIISVVGNDCVSISVI